MNTGLTRRQTPEERELAKKQAELAALEARLAQRELDLATLQAELQTFEGQYLRIVGIRYAELDEIEAQIAALKAQRRPGDINAQEHAAQARAQAQESAQAAGTAPQEQTTFRPSDSLKQLYRQLARLLHPDLTTDPQERERRHRFMAAVNAGYHAGDDARLQAILREWESSPESVTGDSIGSDLVRIIRKIAQVEERLEAIDDEIAALQASDLYQLRAHVDGVATEGRDLLAEMAAQVEGGIAVARERLAELSRKRASR